MDSNQNLLSNELIIDAAGASHLKEAGMWARIVGICGIIFSVFILIVALFTKSIFERAGNIYGGETSGFTSQIAIVVTVIYVIIAVVVFFASLYQYRFGANAKRALATMDQEMLNSCLQNLKGYYRIAGILTLIGLLFFVLGILTTLIGLANGAERF